MEQSWPTSFLHLWYGGRFSFVVVCSPLYQWLLRDFTLELVDKKGHPITSKQYLENALSPIPGMYSSLRNATNAFQKEKVLEESKIE